MAQAAFGCSCHGPPLVLGSHSQQQAPLHLSRKPLRTTGSLPRSKTRGCARQHQLNEPVGRSHTSKSNTCYLGRVSRTVHFSPCVLCLAQSHSSESNAAGHGRGTDSLPDQATQVCTSWHPCLYVLYNSLCDNCQQSFKSAGPCAVLEGAMGLERGYFCKLFLIELLSSTPCYITDFPRDHNLVYAGFCLMAIGLLDLRLLGCAMCAGSCWL